MRAAAYAMDSVAEPASGEVREAVEAKAAKGMGVDVRQVLYAHCKACPPAGDSHLPTQPPFSAQPCAPLTSAGLGLDDLSARVLDTHLHHNRFAGTGRWFKG